MNTIDIFFLFESIESLSNRKEARANSLSSLLVLPAGNWSVVIRSQLISLTKIDYSCRTLVPPQF